MEFFKCSVAGVSYGTGVTEIERAAARRNGTAVRAPRCNNPWHLPCQGVPTCTRELLCRTRQP